MAVDRPKGGGASEQTGEFDRQLLDELRRVAYGEPEKTPVFSLDALAALSVDDYEPDTEVQPIDPFADSTPPTALPDAHEENDTDMDDDVTKIWYPRGALATG